MSETINLSLDGYTDLPPGKIASLVTYLEMRAPPVRSQGGVPPGLALQPLSGRDEARYRTIFRTIGERWLWFGRLRLSSPELSGLLDDPAIAAWAVTRDGRDCGLAEVDFREPGQAEIVYFGLYEDVVGRGVGHWLMAQVLEAAWARPVERVWLHTCNLDHPGAVAFYRRAGFRAYKLGVEVCGDPRLDGTLPRGAAPHVPLVDG